MVRLVPPPPRVRNARRRSFMLQSRTSIRICAAAIVFNVACSFGWGQPRPPAATRLLPPAGNRGLDQKPPASASNSGQSSTRGNALSLATPGFHGGDARRARVETTPSSARGRGGELRRHRPLGTTRATDRVVTRPPHATTDARGGSGLRPHPRPCRTANDGRVREHDRDGAVATRGMAGRRRIQPTRAVGTAAGRIGNTARPHG